MSSTPASPAGLLAWKMSSSWPSGITVLGTVKLTVCFLSFSGPNPRSLPWTGVSLVQVMSCTCPLRGSLVLSLTISPRSTGTPFTETMKLSPSVQPSIWYRVKSTVTVSAGTASGPELGGTVKVVDIWGSSLPMGPRKLVKSSGSWLLVLPVQEESKEDSKSSVSNTTSG